MPGKRITIDELAVIMKKGLDNAVHEVELLRRDTVAGFALVNGRLGEVDARLSSVERLLTSSRIDRIEDDLRVLKTKAGIH